MLPIFRSCFSFKHLSVILLLTLAAYANTLFNGFVGDDNILFLSNTFYSSPSNIPRVFSRSYNTSGSDITLHPRADKGSGSVAYRPVLTLTYFFDYALWGQKPFGYHLTNLTLHMVNVTLVYFFVLLLFTNGSLAFWTAALFSLHPIQHEAVAAIGYRADLLIALWGLAASISWILYREGHERFYYISLFCYFMAVFSKESSFLFPLWILCYDRWKNVSWEDVFRRIAPFILVSFYYLYLYFIVFPNTAIGVGDCDFFAKLSILGQIWAQYLTFLFVPLMTVPFPGFYHPFAKPLTETFELWLVVFIGVLVFFRSFQLSRQGVPYYLMVLWFMLFFLPASGLIPNPNLAALRYLYLPMVGGYVLLAMLILKISDSGYALRLTCNAKYFIFLLIAGFCFIATVSSNALWKDNLTIGRAWVREFPDSYKGYNSIGVFFYDRGFYYQATAFLEDALSDPRLIDPATPYLLGRCYLRIGRYKAAERLFNGLVEKLPMYYLAYQGRAMYYYAKMDYPNAIEDMKRAIVLEQTSENFGLLLDVYRKQGDSELFERTFEGARVVLSGDSIALKALEAESMRNVNKMDEAIVKVKLRP